jgi:arginine repressor
MSYKAAVKRFVKIIDFVERKNFPSRDEIISFLNEDEYQISISTFKRDLNVLDIDFGLEIKDNPIKRGYFLDKENSESSDTFLRVIQLLHTSEILKETIKENRENLKYLAFDNSASFNGVHLLSRIV